MSVADPPPTLLFFDAPLQVGEGAGTDASAVSAAAKTAAKVASDLEDVINSILPPRCVRARGRLCVRECPRHVL